MTPRQKVGQLLLYGFPGTTVESAVPIVEAYEPGGIVFVSNATNPERAAILTQGIQEAARRTGLGVPVILAVDHEAGFVQRVKGDAAWFPGNLVLGATWSPDLAYAQGSVQGRELRAMGFNMNLAPVLDVDNYTDNPIIGAFDRSLGERPEQVSLLGTAYIRGLQEAGIMATAKHYPGHGSTSVDSHVALPTVRHDRAALDEFDLPPFAAAARQGVAAVMAGHLSFPLVDATLPTSLSPTFIDGVLRREFEYDGIVMTDSLGMGAITQGYSMPAAALQSIMAGSDMVLVVGPADARRSTFQGILDAVQGGRITEERLDRSVRRILRAKAAFGIFDDSSPNDGSAVGSEGHLQAIQRVADGAITLVRDRMRRIPAQLQTGAKILVVRPATVPRTGSAPLVGAELRAQRPELDVTELIFSFSGDNSEVHSRALALARTADLVVVATVDAGPWQQSLVSGLVSVGSDPIVIGLDTPREVLRLPDVSTYVAAYRGYEVLIRAAVRLLLGEIRPLGRLPYGVSEDYPAGFGLGISA